MSRKRPAAAIGGVGPEADMPAKGVRSEAAEYKYLDVEEAIPDEEELVAMSEEAGKHESAEICSTLCF